MQLATLVGIEKQAYIVVAQRAIVGQGVDFGTKCSIGKTKICEQRSYLFLKVLGSFLAEAGEGVRFLLQVVESLVHQFHSLFDLFVDVVGFVESFFEVVLNFEQFTNSVDAVFFLQTVDGVKLLIDLLLALGRECYSVVQRLQCADDVA